MRIKSSVLFGLIVVICAISGFSLLKRLTHEVDEWRPSDLYSSTNVSRRSTYSVVSSAPVSYSEALPTVSSGSGSMFRRRAVSSYAPASGLAGQSSMTGTASYSQSPIAYSQGLHTTSSAEFRSFGGGGNAGGGVSMSGGTIKSTSSSIAPATSLSISMPSTQVYTYNNGVASSDIAMASSYQGIGNTTGGAKRGIGGRHDAPPSYGGNGNPSDNPEGDDSGWGNTWLNWLDYKYGERGSDDTGYGFTWSELGELYNEWCEEYRKNNPGVIPPSINDWYAWFYGSDGTTTHTGGIYGNEFSFVPVGDILPILIMALMYMGVVAVRRHKKLLLKIKD